MTTLLTQPNIRKKTLLTIVWLSICGFFALLLLHPAVPALLRAVVAKPNRVAAEAVEYVAHAAVFFVATELALVCLDGRTRRRRLGILSLAAIAGLAAEYAQRWVPGRGVDVFDAACNLAGIAAAAIVYRRLFSPALVLASSRSI